MEGDEDDISELIFMRENSTEAERAIFMRLPHLKDFSTKSVLSKEKLKVQKRI